MFPFRNAAREAAKINDMKTFRELIGPNNVNDRDEDDYTILHDICEDGSYDAVQYICSLNVTRLNIRCSFEWKFRTPLHICCVNTTGDGDIINLLIEAGANPYKTDLHDYTPCTFAAYLGNLSCLRELCKVTDCNYVNKYGKTPLLLATLWGHYDCCEYLLDIGADVNITTPQFNSILGAACGFRYKVRDRIEKYGQIIRLLIDRGANVEASHRYSSRRRTYADDVFDHRESLRTKALRVLCLRRFRSRTLQRNGRDLLRIAAMHIWTQRCSEPPITFLANSKRPRK